MGENIFKCCDWQRLSFQNIQTAHTKKQQKQPNRKMWEDLKKHFSKEEIEMANRQMKRSASIIVREMQIKVTNTMRYNLIMVWMVIIKCLQITNAREGVEKGNLPYTVGDSTTVENSMEVPHKTKDRIIIWSSNPTPGYISRQNYTLKRYVHPYVHSSSIHNSQNMAAISMSIN